MLNDNVFMDEVCRKLAVDTIVRDIRDKVDIAVIGLSGGADSTLVATLCTLALGSNNVYGVGMPYSKTDECTFNNRSSKLANKLGIQYETFPITNVVDVFADNFGLMSTLNQGNLRSRMRMVTLYSMACSISEDNKTKRIRVIGTGNKSEDFIGYDTKGGDALADIFPIGELYKQDVYNMLDDFVTSGILEDDLIDRIPSAGLWEGQTDENELGKTYNEMAPSIKFFTERYEWFIHTKTRDDLIGRLEYMMNKGIINIEDIDIDLYWFVWNRHITNKHKHEAPYVTPLTYKDNI